MKVIWWRLVNSQGELVGINTASFQQATDMKPGWYFVCYPLPTAKQ